MADSESGGWAQPVRSVRFWQLVLPIVVGVAALFLTQEVWSNARATIADWTTTGGARNGYVIAYLMMAVLYVAGLLALRFALGPVGATTMVADFGRARMGWIVAGLVAGVALLFAEMVTLAVASDAGVEFTENTAQRALMPLSQGELVIAFATAAIAGPYFEEMYFRGAMLSWFRDRIGVVAAVLVSSALFGLAHGQFAATPGAQGWIATGFLSAVGLVACVLALRSRSLWPPFAAHAAFNGTTVALWFLMPTIN